ncbi:hypothetical protein TNCV_4037541, partial [Trichonephila clavipes]
SLVYADKPQTLDHLEDNIRRVIADIRPQMLEKVIENWTSRLDYIRASRGNHMPEIIFKIPTKTDLSKVVGMSFPSGRKESCQSLRQIGLLHEWQHHISPPPQFRHELEAKEIISSIRGFCCDRPEDFQNH